MLPHFKTCLMLVIPEPNETRFSPLIGQALACEFKALPSTVFVVTLLGMNPYHGPLEPIMC